jgi:hypothetical protein
VPVSVEVHCAAWIGKERERKREEEKQEREREKKKEGRKIEKMNYLFLEIVICNLY